MLQNYAAVVLLLYTMIPSDFPLCLRNLVLEKQMTSKISIDEVF